MKIQVASDLHTEMYYDYGRSVCENLVKDGGADILVLAGDIGSARYIENYSVVLDELTPYYNHIVVTCGNHEYYKSDKANVDRTLERLEEGYNNLHVLRNDFVVLDGQRFIGGTGWFGPPTPDESIYKIYMNDFRIIKDFESFCYSSNTELGVLLIKELKESDVLVTHHIPASSVAPQYANNALNPFFKHGLDDIVFSDTGPKLYIHGHTHEQMDYVRTGTRVVANPLGYPSEETQQSKFNFSLFIEV